jgi:L-ascorbate metabolism protein UlaG (beta-lactamase superfamily)
MTAMHVVDYETSTEKRTFWGMINSAIAKNGNGPYNNIMEKVRKHHSRRWVMGRYLFFSALAFLLFPGSADAQQGHQMDTIPTAGGDLEITFIGHGTLMFTFGGKVIHVDPVSQYADYTRFPKADIILITHDHRDHLDPGAVKVLGKAGTDLVLSAACAEKLGTGMVMHNGETRTVQGIKIEAVPAYNLVHMRSEGVPFHPKGRGNGYVLTFGDKRVYVAGDTENIPEMAALKGIDIAFLPMNLPYTMTPEMVADAAMTLRPKILYPYHYGDTDTSKLLRLLRDRKDMEIRIRDMQ